MPPKVQFQVQEIEPLSRHQTNRKIKTERLSTYAERHGIHGIAFCADDDMELLEEINFHEIDYKWYDQFKGSELKALFKEKRKDNNLQNLSNFARIKYETAMRYDSDDSGYLRAEKKKKRKRFNSGSVDQSIPRED